MEPNPYDPWKRDDLTENEKTVLRFMDEIMHGDNLALLDELVAEDYIQHTPGIGQGREGVRKYIQEVGHRRPGRHDWRPIQIFSQGDMVILHKISGTHVFADFVRFNENGQMAEHWDVVQPHPEQGYDPMRPSTENLDRFKKLFDLD